MDWRLFVASRYFKTRRKERFISIISLISILGVAVGVTALIITIAIMSGFNKELKTRIIGTTPHIIIERDGGVIHPDLYIEKVLSNNESVIGYSYFVSGQGMLKCEEKFSGVIINGIDEATEKNVVDIKQYVKGKVPDLGKTGLLVGSELARELNLKVGDVISLISAVSARLYDFKIIGIFQTGLYTFDVNNIFIGLEPAQKVFNINQIVTGVAVKIDSEMEADKIKKEIIAELDFPYFVMSWIDLNRNLFSALKLEKIVMFGLTTIIVVVACFNIASTLIIRVVEKTKDIGILKAIGATNSDIRTIFRLEGLFAGLIGTVLGIGIGLCANWIQNTYKIVRLPSEVYYIDALPMYIYWHDSFVIAFSAIVLSWVATIYPSTKAARLEVVDALRYE